MSDLQILSREPHHADHIRPVIQALPAGVDCRWVHNPDQLEPNTLTLVAAARDCSAATRRGLPIVMSEHGCGLRYNVDHASYAGGPGRGNVVLFLNLNELVDRANRAAYPRAKHAIVGSPRLDQLAARPAPAPAATPIVAFSWHWDCKVVPETRSAFQHYRRGLPAVAKRNGGQWQPLGHAHPRAWQLVRPAYRVWRWPIAEQFEQVVDEATVYVCDNSSTIFEWAALDRPVVVVNSPAYRKHVTHGDGLRFWAHVPGQQVDKAEQLDAAIARALGDDPWHDERRRIAELVYPHRGEAARRSADAILDLL